MPIVLFFIILNTLFITGTSMLNRWNADKEVLIFGNILLFAVTFFSLIVARKGLQSTNPHAFVRAVYSSILLKLFVCMIAAFIYISIFKQDLNKPAFFTLMGLYLVYTFIEVAILTKMLKVKADG
ncbi:MAG TPA: hypothetical protein VM888_13310 [Chitinophagaceae bacterium]|nr:hypothetical protein [Chitinophagaceae bacterium]